jgi:hypothetical protein
MLYSPCFDRRDFNGYGMLPSLVASQFSSAITLCIYSKAGYLRGSFALKPLARPQPCEPLVRHSRSLSFGFARYPRPRIIFTAGRNDTERAVR